MICHDARNKLEPYVDSELSAAELAEFESHLRGCASCAADVAGMMKLKAMTRTAALRYAPSPEFRLRMDQSVHGGRKLPLRAVWLTGLAAAGATAVLAVALFTLWITRSDQERAFAELADMHVATLASTNPVDVVSTDRHTVKPWFAGRIPFSFNLPELQNTGFTLAGGRVCYFHRNPGAQLIFNLRKHELSVFIFQEQPDVLPLSPGDIRSTKLAFQMETWAEGGLRYFIISDAAAADVHALSELMKQAARS